MHVLWLIALAALLVGALSVWMLEDQIYAELRARHPDVWKSLGSPDRFFDDFGSARHFALERLYGEPELLRVCSVELLRRLKLRRRIGRICLGGAGVALAVGLAQYLGVL